MITTILLLIIGIKLNILNGWYLALIITKTILDIVDFGIKCIKIGLGDNND